MDLTQKFPKISFPGSGGLKVSILFVSGNSLLLLLLGFYELDPPGVPLRSLLEGIPFYPLSFLAFAVFSGSCFLLQKRQTDRMRKELGGQKETLEKTVTLLEEVTGFYQSSSLISARKDESLLLDLIARESLKCLRAHRAILFLQGEGSPQPKVGSVFASETAHESANLEVEKECARRTLSQRRALLFREPRDFADLFPKGGKNRSVCSLLSVPLIWLGKPLGALNVSLMSGDRKFNEKDLEFLSLFSHHAAAAIQNTADGGKVNLHRDFDLELERIAAGLRRLSRDEQREILGQFQELLAKRGAETIGGSPNKPSGLSGTSVSSGGFQSGPTPRPEKGGEEKIMYVTPGDEAFEFSEEFGDGGLFIRTPNPLELGERFLLRLHNGNGDEPIEVTCKVIWTNQYGKESKHLSRGMGVKFMDLRREDRKKLQDYLKTPLPVAEASA
ncbi:MAG: PilZ domain-containing protein [Deltaproteobacteria bacterium]|nr:PilZ domain-containing protein [Deltaproteobacteria bacterium]